MTETKKNGNRKNRAFAFLIIGLLAIILSYNALFGYGYTIGPNYRNISVDTTVNITDAKPEILAIIIDDPITLNAGTTTFVECNISARDWNGGDTITNVSAVFYDNLSVSMGAPEDNNTYYVNSTCQNTSINGYYANFTCGFTVLYYANPGAQWLCNATITDSHVFNATVNSSVWDYNTTTINTLLALNVTTLIDYGDMAVGDTSTPQEANITNFGNADINISVKGYGATENDGLALVCDVGDIAIANEKFSLNETGDFLVDYTSLASAFQMVGGLTLPQQINDSQQVINQTYWRLYVPPNPFGVCNGTIVFQAEAAN